MNIMLVCAMGMSTSLLVQKMKQAAKEAGKEYKIWATDVDSVEDEEEHYDIVMIGPQVSWRLAEIEGDVDGKAPVVVIDKTDYGKCNGASVLSAAEELLKKKE